MTTMFTRFPGLKIPRLPRRLILPALQLLTGVLTVLASAYEWSAWWLCAVPWMVLNLPGIVLALPVIAAAYLTAGTAGLDWRSHDFFAGWCIAAPTILAVLFCVAWTEWRRRRGPPPLRRN
jgi:hypothetical protein